jgi:hypothetical protein
MSVQQRVVVEERLVTDGVQALNVLDMILDTEVEFIRGIIPLHPPPARTGHEGHGSEKVERGRNLAFGRERDLKHVIIVDVFTSRVNGCLVRKLLRNVFYHYFANYHYFAHPQTLFFTFLSRRRQRRRQQYEIFQKIFYETSLTIAKIYLLIISIQNKQTFQLIDSQHSIFTF